MVVAWPNLSRDPIVSEVASAVKTCYSHSWILGQVVYVSDRIILGAEHLDPGSSSTPARPAVANVVKNSHTDGLGQT